MMYRVEHNERYLPYSITKIYSRDDLLARYSDPHIERMMEGMKVHDLIQVDYDHYITLDIERIE